MRAFSLEMPLVIALILWTQNIAILTGTEFVRPHSIRIDHGRLGRMHQYLLQSLARVFITEAPRLLPAEDNVWLVDDMANTITKCTQNGKRLMMLLPGGRVLTTQREMKNAVGKVHTDLVM